MPVINLESNEILRMTRELGLKVGKFKGSGIYMSQQTFYGCLEKGDHVWDGDFGYMIWDGREWLCDKDVKERTKTTRK